MKLTARQQKALLVAGLLIGLAGHVYAFGLPLSGGGYEQSGAISYNATSGPNATLIGSTNVQNGSAFPDSNTVELVTTDGNVTLSSSSHTNATIQTSNITGTYSNVTDLDVSGAELTINPEDKPKISVQGGTDTLAWRTPTLDDGVADIVWSGSSGTTNLTIHGVPADTLIIAVDSTGTALGGNKSTSNGVVTINDLPNSQHTVRLTADSGGPGLSNPNPEGPQDGFPSELSVDVDDPDFSEGDNVSVEFYLDGNKVGTEKATSAGDVSTSISGLSRGSHTVKVNATDINGNEQTLTYEFSVIANLTIRNATVPHDVIDDRNVEVTFYQGDDVVNKTTGSGEVTLDGLDANESVVAGIDAPDYRKTFVVIDDPTANTTAYMLNTTQFTNHEIQFVLNDRTGQFDDNDPELYIQKPINRNGELEYRTVYSDKFGASGIIADLEDGQTYRLIIRNEDGDMRVIGRYTPTISETVQLTVGGVSAAPGGNNQEFSYNASYLNTSSGQFVQFVYNDTEVLTDSVTISIYEKGNKNNVLVDNQTFSGPLGDFALTEPVPNGEENTTWVVDVTVERDGNTETIQEAVGPQRPQLSSLSGWIVATISIGAIWLVAGLFSQLNGDVGGLVVAGMGGLFYYLDFLPEETGIGVVVLALITAALLFLQERRGA